MQPIYGLAPGAAQSPAAVRGVKGTPEVHRPGGEEQGRPLKPVMDKYIPEEKQEPSGRYWLGKDEDGKPKICFDDPERAADAPEQPSELPGADDPEHNEGAEGPDKQAAGDKAESCTGNTDKVDREIEKLKKEKEELERQINSETDDTKIKELEKKLAQVERELRQRDNDTYRRQHAAYTFS